MSRLPSPSPSTAYCEEARRHELGLAHGAGPGAEHPGRTDMVPLDHLQRGDQLPLEVAGALAVKRQGRKRPDDGILPRVAAEIALHAPGCEDDRPRHTIERLDGVERRGPLPGKLAAAPDAPARDRAVEIGRDRLRELGLRPADHGDLRVRGHALEGEIEGRAGNATRLSLGPEALQVARELGRRSFGLRSGVSGLGLGCLGGRDRRGVAGGRPLGQGGGGCQQRADHRRQKDSPHGPFRPRSERRQEAPPGWFGSLPSSPKLVIDTLPSGNCAVISREPPSAST